MAVSVITTAYPNFALQGFELDVLDYLIKPFPFERLLKAANKARDFYQMINKPETQASDFFFVKCEHRYEKILFREVTFVEGMENYVVIHTLTQKFVTLMRMKTIEDLLPAANFIRTHKSYIVAMGAITSIDGNDLVVAGKYLPMSREKKTEIMELLLKQKRT